MSLETLWFVLIAFFWAGYLALEGFDFGVGMLLPWVGRDEADRTTMLRTIGPVWDGNEVWLVVAGAATFAAFPAWYATMFSGFYVALLLILVLLIIRVVSFEWRSKSEESRWRSFWTWCNTIGSVGIALIWGVGLSNLVNGVPIDSNGDYAGDLLGSLQPVHGLRRCRGRAPLRLSRGDVPRAPDVRRAPHPGRGCVAKARAAGDRARRRIPRLDGRGRDGQERQGSLPARASGDRRYRCVASRRRRACAQDETAARSPSPVSLPSPLVATLFTSLYPRVMVSSPSFDNSLTVDGAAASGYSLKVMSVVALIFVPLILLYQGWTYYVFRRRLGLDTPTARAGREEVTTAPQEPAGP